MRVRALLLAGTVATITACGSIAPLPSDTYYRLNISASQQNREKSATWTEKLVRVAKFQASGVHRERAIAFTDTDQLVVKQHDYHMWTDTPERLLQTELVSYLRAAGVAPTITTTDIGSNGYLIQGRINRMDHILDGRAESVEVALAFELIESGAQRQVVMGRDYRESRAISAREMGATASAMSGAIVVIFERFVSDAHAAIVAREAVPQ